MAESREQFRDRIGYLNYRTTYHQDDTKFVRRLWEDDRLTQGRHSNGAEAVYAAALRDVLAIIRRSEGDLDYAVFAITLHATERDLDLDDAP